MGFFDSVGDTVKGAAVGTFNPLLGGPLGGVMGGAAGAGMPMPGFMKNTPFDPNTWSKMAGQFTGQSKKDLQHSGQDMATPEMSQYVPGANTINSHVSIGQSPWASMALQNQAGEQSQLLDQANKNAAASTAQGMSNLSMKGGLSSGAAERMAMGGADNMALARQNVLGQGAQQRAQIGMNQADRDTDINKFNTTMQNSNEQFNANVLNQNAANNNMYNAQKYGEQMKLKGAGMQSDAIANGGKK